MITEEKLAELRQRFSHMGYLVWLSGGGDSIEAFHTLSALWRVCRAAEAYYKSNTGLSHICYESGTGKDLEDALAALRSEEKK